MTPSVLIVGAQRCGTTSMMKTLSQHPAVLPPLWQKGLHYFDVHYHLGPSWYRGFFPLLSTAALVERRTGLPPLTLESSPYYMFHPLAAQRIAHDLPRVRLIVLLRDPVERAYSAYTHERARGFERESFETALELEEHRVDGEAERVVGDVGYDSLHLQHNAYLRRGRYVEQLERLEALFGRERIHVVDSADFFSAPAPAFNAVLDFLGLPHRDGIAFEQHNARPRAPLNDSLRQRLEEHFQPFDDRLTSWLGAAPSWRR